jgi:hypothetical protein
LKVRYKFRAFHYMGPFTWLDKKLVCVIRIKIDFFDLQLIIAVVKSATFNPNNTIHYYLDFFPAEFTLNVYLPQADFCK